MRFEGNLAEVLVLADAVRWFTKGGLFFHTGASKIRLHRFHSEPKYKNIDMYIRICLYVSLIWPACFTKIGRSEVSVLL